VNLPSGLGYEAFGTVSAVGPEVDPTLIGKRFGTIPGYSMNQYPVLAEEPSSPLAFSQPFLTPSPRLKLPLSGCSTRPPMAPLVPFGKVAAGDFVIITAASSSVGLAAIQIVKAQGGISIATTRTSAKKDQLIALGADHVIVTEEEDLVAGCSRSQAARVRASSSIRRRRLHQHSRAGHGERWHIFVYGGLSASPHIPHGCLCPNHRHVRYTFGELRGTAEWETMKKYIYDHSADGSSSRRSPDLPFDQTVEAYKYSKQRADREIVITL